MSNKKESFAQRLVTCAPTYVISMHTDIYLLHERRGKASNYGRKQIWLKSALHGVSLHFVTKSMNGDISTKQLVSSIFEFMVTF